MIQNDIKIDSKNILATEDTEDTESAVTAL
jgi:hypothetical protein